MPKFYKQELVNPKTGEVVKVIGFIPEFRDEDYAKIFELFSKKVLEDLDMLNGASSLLLWFIAQTTLLPYQSDLWIPVNYKELAKELGISEVSVKRHIKKLLDLGYIEQFSNRNTTFRIKPDYMFKGILTKYKNDEMEMLEREYFRRKQELEQQGEE